MTFGTLSYASPQGPPSLENNRRPALLAFGVISILLGVAASVVALVVFCILIPELIAPKTIANIPEMVLSIGTYAFFAIGFIALGVASIKCRRWIRPGVMAFATVIIVGSILKFTAITAAWDKIEMRGHEIHRGDADANFAAGVFGSLIVLSLIYLRFYATDSVRQTLQAYDVKSSWCEQCPLPVLIAAAGLFIAGTGVILLSSDTRSPFDIARMNGTPSFLIKAIYGAIILFSAYLVYGMRVQGVWLATITLFLGFAANLVTRLIAAPANVSAVHRELIGQLGISGPESATPQMTTPTFTVALTGVICVGYLLWVHRYFRRPLPVFQ
jgi:hypothetical protein